MGTWPSSVLRSAIITSKTMSMVSIMDLRADACDWRAGFPLKQITQVPAMSILYLPQAPLSKLS